MKYLQQLYFSGSNKILIQSIWIKIMFYSYLIYAEIQEAFHGFPINRKFPSLPRNIKSVPQNLLKYRHLSFYSQYPTHHAAVKTYVYIFYDGFTLI